MDFPDRVPPYYNLIILTVFAILFFYFLYELAQGESPWLDGAIMLLCGTLAIRNYVKWKEKLSRPIR